MSSYRRKRTPRSMRSLVLLVSAVLAVVAAAPAAASADTSRHTANGIPPDVTAGIAVFDRDAGGFTEQHNATKQFRSASIVKLLITLDFFWNRGPDYSIPDADRDRLQIMLRSSANDPASYYWSHRGSSKIIDRMVSRLGLTGTEPPPAEYPGYWGYVAITPLDTVRTYQYILDSAPAPVRDFIMGNLRKSTRCATDGYDQHFGIPSAFQRPWAVKQGWSGFSSGGCTAAPGVAAPGVAASGVTGAGSNDVDLVSEALHSTGTVGADDRSIVAVYTLHPDGTAYGEAYSKLTSLVDGLNVPGAQRPEGTRFDTYGSGVRVRADATTDSAQVTTLPAGVEVLVTCQQQGETVSKPPYENDWWAYLPQYDGYMTNIYMKVEENKLPGIPRC